MVNEKSRSELINVIKRKLINSSNADYKNKVQELLTTKDKYESAHYMKIIIGFVGLETIPNEELLWFVQAMENVGKELRVGEVKTKDYFTEHEIKSFKSYRRNKVNHDELMTLQNAWRLSVKEKEYTAIISFKQLALMKRNGYLRVDPEMQRQSKEREFGEIILREIKTYPVKIKEIKELIVNGKYFPDEIVLNLMDDGEHFADIDEENKVIRLPEGGDLIIVDGNNRSLAVEQAYSDHPELDEYLANIYFPITFTNFDVDGVKAYLDQKWKATPVSKSHKDAMKRSNANQVVDSIKLHPKIYKQYKDAIVTTMEEIRFGHGFILYSLLSDAIEKEYSINSSKSPKQINELVEWLVKFMNEVYDIMEIDFSNYKETKNGKWSVSPYAGIVYIYLSARLKNDTNWKPKLSLILSSINWNKSFYEELVGTGKSEKSVRQFIQERWESVV